MYVKNGVIFFKNFFQKNKFMKPFRYNFVSQCNKQNIPDRGQCQLTQNSIDSSNGNK